MQAVGASERSAQAVADANCTDNGLEAIRTHSLKLEKHTSDGASDSIQSPESSSGRQKMACTQRVEITTVEKLNHVSTANQSRSCQLKENKNIPSECICLNLNGCRHVCV